MVRRLINNIDKTSEIEETEEYYTEDSQAFIFLDDENSGGGDNEE